MKLLYTIAALLVSAAVTCHAQSNRQPHHVSEYPTSTVREEQTVIINGQPETWRLQWNSVPTQQCERNEGSLSCPCIGFAYGEAGDLFLVRLRDGNEVERLRFTGLFTEQEQAVVQRWSPDYGKDFKLSDRADFPAIVAKRPVVQVVHFADYDHDGQATEFYLQTDTLPCGKSTGVVIGVSKKKPRLHVFGTASNPNKPLYLQKREWEALRDASSTTVKIVDWPCGDHAAETEMEVQLNWSAQGIDGVRQEYTCPEKGKRKRLIKEKRLSETEP